MLTIFDGVVLTMVISTKLLIYTLALRWDCDLQVMYFMYSYLWDGGCGRDVGGRVDQGSDNASPRFN